MRTTQYAIILPEKIPHRNLYPRNINPRGKTGEKKARGNKFYNLNRDIASSSPPGNWPRSRIDTFDVRKRGYFSITFPVRVSVTYAYLGTRC